MAQFVFHVADEKVELSTMEDQKIKRSFEEFKSRIEAVLGTMTCPEHHREPRLLIRHRQIGPIIGGFGTCCDSMGKRVKALIAEHGIPVQQIWMPKKRSPK